MMLIVMQILRQKVKLSSIVFEKLGILSENLKTLPSSKQPTNSYLPMYTKERAGFFYFV